jgi:P4 family phage/plasmid primase-like protien
MSPLDRPLAVTFFRDHMATTKDEKSLTLRQLVPMIRTTSAPEKAALPWLKLASFGDGRTPKGSLRNNANVLAIDGIEADYDAGVMTPEQAVAALAAANLAAVVYTSPSHQAHTPKWRVLCPLADTTMPEERATLAGRLNGVLGGALARESFTLSQSFYYGSVRRNPAHVVLLVEGRPLDEAVELEAVQPAKVELPKIKPAAKPATPAPEGGDRGLPAAALREACALFEGQTGVGRHQVLLAATLVVAPFVASGHLPEDEVVTGLTEAMSDSGRDPNDNEVESALAGALKDARPWEPPTGGAEFDGEDAPARGNATALAEPTEDAALRAFCAVHVGEFAFDHDDKRWYAFDPSVGWRRDDDNSITRAVRGFVRRARKHWGDDKASSAMAHISFTRNVESGCQAEEEFATTRSAWDANPFVLGVPGGSVDLRTGRFQPAISALRVLRRTSVAPAPTGTLAPRWHRFLSEATGDNADMMRWLQRWAGYCLTGDVSEEMFAFAYGPGGNGKGVLVATLGTILGDYGYQAPAELFKADTRTNREYQLANLDGVRLLIASETEAGSALAESFVKELTGNEGKINARQPYGRAFQFRTQAKLLVVGNHAPSLQGRSPAMQRRMRVLPFNHTPAEPDPELKAKLVAEHSAILAWAIEGAQIWLRERLGKCPAIEAASAAYFDEQDTVSQWISERCDAGGDLGVLASDALASFNDFLRTRGERPVNARGFADQLGGHPGITKAHTRKGAEYRGIGLRSCGAGDDLTWVM